MTNIIDSISYENPVFRTYVFWTSILVVKMLAMSFITIAARKKKKVPRVSRFLGFSVPSPKDVQFIPDGKGKFRDPDVERVRRAHRNDLENILPFMIIGFLYVLTDPSTFIAVNLFRAGAIARIAHTYVYAINPMQPARGISYIICVAATAYMSLSTAWFFC